MSILDERGKWMKRWFVLGDASLTYYRDSEESDDPDGEIDLTSCVDVSDCDVETDYGLQIQTKRAVFTLCVMTSRVRRNWVKLLKQAIHNNTHQSEAGGQKANPPSRRPSSCQPARFTCVDSAREPTTSSSSNAAAQPDDSRQAERVHRDVDGERDSSPSNQREDGEGWDREQAKRLEDRNRWFEEGVPFGAMGSRWDSVELKRGSVPVPVIQSVTSEVNRKWVEFETLSFRDMSAQSLIGAQRSSSSPPSQRHAGSHTPPPAAAAAPQTDISSSTGTDRCGDVQNKADVLQKEALSLRKQVENIKRERAAMEVPVEGLCGPGAPCRARLEALEVQVESPCGPGAPCRARLEALEVSHRQTLKEVQERHARELEELEEQRDRMLQEERRAAAEAMEALKAAHREELQKEVQEARRVAAGGAHVDAPHGGHMPQGDVLHGELDDLSERFAQKCLELNRSEQSGRGRDSELQRKDKELELLRRENQELKVKLAEEMSRMRCFITGQRSDTLPLANAERSASQVETLLRAKDNKVQYLQKEISCLQNEVQSLTKEKDAAYERYKEAYVELSDLRGRSHLEANSLHEHLRLATAALQEGAGHT